MRTHKIRPFCGVFEINGVVFEIIEGGSKMVYRNIPRRTNEAAGGPASHVYKINDHKVTS